MLLPPDLRDWVPEDDIVHFVIEAVERMPWTPDSFAINLRGTGSKQYSPRMMLALLVYCYANGIFSSRRIERATYRDIGVRYLTGDSHTDHDTICEFRRRNQTVEPVFGIIKSVLGFRQFLRRGLDNVRREWTLVTMAWNMKRMFVLAGAI